MAHGEYDERVVVAREASSLLLAPHHSAHGSDGALSRSSIQEVNAVRISLDQEGGRVQKAMLESKNYRLRGTNWCG